MRIMNDYRGLWQAVLGELEVSISRANFATWFKHTSIVASEDGRVVVAVPNIITKDWLEKKYHNDIKAVLDKINGAVHSVEYRIGSPVAVEQSIKASGGQVAKTAAEQATSATDSKPTSLNRRYTFDNFVVGSSNELAYAAAQAVAKSPGTKYSPLFVYGGVGLGKTHLIQAIGNEVLRRDPSKKVEYITSESFTNEFISSISRKKNDAFTDKYRKVDVLIVDDMQFLAGKEKTQDEFFHTFNALHHGNKQIIISSDKPPQAIAGLEERLRSRFGWGMTADIQPPDLETRSAILQSKAAAQGVALPLDIVDYLARNVPNNIRELEGALTQLMAHCEFRSIDPSVAMAAGLLSSIAASRPKPKPLTPKTVIEKTANYYDLQVADLTGPKRDKDIVVPRQIAMYLMRHELGLSFPKIASALGGRDHTTAMHSVSKIDGQMEANENLRLEISAIKERLLV